MSPSERRLREDTIYAAATLRAVATASPVTCMIGGARGVTITYDTLDQVLAALEGWKYVRPTEEGG